MVRQRKKAYVPDRGEFVWFDFDPIRGHEENGRRPALVLSPKLFNARSRLAFVCPLTSRVKGYPFEVEASVGGRPGALLVDQIRSIDWTRRKAERIGKAPAALVLRVQEKLKPLLFA